MYLLARLFIWQAVANEYLIQRKDKRGLPWNYCEVHNEIAKDIQVHHKRPVHTLDFTNYKLCWDLTNLIGVCVPCHGKQHKKVNLEVKYQNYAKIDQFLKKGEKAR
jgi:5-methylcytosine-specific restriction endonuclease McrA